MPLAALLLVYTTGALWPPEGLAMMTTVTRMGLKEGREPEWDAVQALAERRHARSTRAA